MQILEAFRALNALNEDTFSLDADGVDKLSNFTKNDDLEDDIQIIDPEAETAEELQDNYIGKVILDCCVCHSKLYKDPSDVVIDENGELANVGEECPYCFTPDGFKVIGEVAAFVDKAAEDDDEEEEESSEESLEEGLLPSMPKLPGLGEEVEDEEAVEEGLLSDVNVSLDASGQSVGLLGGTGGSVTNEELDDEELEEGIFGNKYKGKMILVYRGGGKDEPLAIADNSGSSNLIEFENAHAKKNGNEKSDYKRVAATDMAVKQYKKALKSIPDVSSDLPGWVNQYVKDAKAQRALDFDNAERQRAREVEARRYDSRYTKNNSDDDGRVYVQGKGTGTYKYREELEEGAFNGGQAEGGFVDTYARPNGSTSQLTHDKLNGKRTKTVKARDIKPGMMTNTGKVRTVTDRGNKMEIGYGGIGPRGTYVSDSVAYDKEYQVLDEGKDVEIFASVAKNIRTNKENMNESIDDLSMTANDTHIEVSEDESGKVTVTAEPVTADGEETIAPVSPETEAEITSEDELPAEGEETPEEEVDSEIDADFDEFDEESMDGLGESYFKKVYENVNSFKTTAVKTFGNSMIIEGLLEFNSGNKKNTSFIFEALDATKSGKFRFVGDNKELTEGKKAFMLTGTINNNKLMVESMNYNYKHIDAEGNTSRVYGTERIK